mgnify:CR=1 FL=1
MTIDDTMLGKYLDDLTSRDHINEAVIVSTCNRIEIFVTAEKFHGAYRDVRDFISDVNSPMLAHLGPIAANATWGEAEIGLRSASMLGRVWTILHGSWLHP